jgi:hypothetical protein
LKHQYQIENVTNNNKKYLLIDTMGNFKIIENSSQPIYSFSNKNLIFMNSKSEEILVEDDEMLLRVKNGYGMDIEKNIDCLCSILKTVNQNEIVNEKKSKISKSISTTEFSKSNSNEKNMNLLSSSNEKSVNLLSTSNEKGIFLIPKSETIVKSPSQDFKINISKSTQDFKNISKSTTIQDFSKYLNSEKSNEEKMEKNQILNISINELTRNEFIYNHSSLLCIWKWVERIQIFTKQYKREKVEYFGVKDILNSLTDESKDLLKLFNFYEIKKDEIKKEEIKKEEIKKEEIKKEETKKELIKNQNNENLLNSKFNLIKKFGVLLFDWLVFSNLDNPDKLTTRDVAKAIFNNNLSLAIKILNKLDDKKNFYKIISLSLIGFSNELKDDFKEIFSESSYKIDDPYIRSSIDFLVSKNNENYSFLYEETIPLFDRLSFAFNFLSKENIFTYVNKLSDSYIKTGNLNGLILNGINKDSIQLFQNYIDKTLDIQSVSLLASLNQSLLQDQTISYWIKSYRNLLDTWEMWEERALFDLEIKANTNSKIVGIKCKFCDKFINSSLNESGFGFRKEKKDSKKITCPHCDKKLPKCSVCDFVLSLNTKDYNSDNITWCSSCKHVAHVSHLLSWFENHVECPVSYCKCNCLEKF